ncbi:MAG TPA: hypothetical protein VFQ35_25835 [Polyangiaceae bacterium]|nr:hypothetical protein [Polyangiaceae bacterium]
MPGYDEALASLYRAPLAEFVSERKRLAKELKAGGDADGARRLSERARPNISAWAVNQLYWQARDEFETMLETAAPLRAGGVVGGAEHRDSLNVLRRRATSILEQSGHAASDATMRRIMTTLSAIAATGGFAPDAPGTLSADRDPPGFEAVGIADDEPRPVMESPKSATVRESPSHRQRGLKPGKSQALEPSRQGAVEEGQSEARERQRREDAVRRERERQEQERAEQEREARERERKRREGERRKVRAELETAQRDVEAKELEVDEQRNALTRAEQGRDRARARAEELERKLAELGDE